MSLAGEQVRNHTWVKDYSQPASHQRSHHQLHAFSHPAHLPEAAAEPAGVHESPSGHDQPQSDRLWGYAQVLRLPGTYCFCMMHDSGI